MVMMFGCLTMTACTQQGKDKLKIEDKEAKYELMQEEFDNLKVITVKNKPEEEYKRIADILYENYFVNKSDATKQWEEEQDEVKRKEYDEEDTYEAVSYNVRSVSYSGLYGTSVEYEYTYEKTEDETIEKETVRLFELIGYEYGGDNGYAIERKVVQEDNSVEVYLCRKIEGSELSITGGINDESINGAEEVELEFGNNQLISASFVCLTDVVEVKDYENEIFVDSPDKACQLFAEYLRTHSGLEKEEIVDTFQISYVASEELETDVYVLKPMAEMIDKVTGNVYQLDLFTKKVEGNVF